MAAAGRAFTVDGGRALHLMGLGAPPELVDETLQAARDEVAHARAAFALAGTGPGPLPLAQDSTPLELPLQEVVRLVFAEGCQHETHAVLRAAGDLRSADGAVRDYLAMVVVDERRHAELAWRTVHWGLGLGAKLTLPTLGSTAADRLIANIFQDLSEPDFEVRLRRRFDDALGLRSENAFVLGDRAI